MTRQATHLLPELIEFVLCMGSDVNNVHQTLKYVPKEMKRRLVKNTNLSQYYNKEMIKRLERNYILKDETRKFIEGTR